MHRARTYARAFSLVELVIVVVIIGIIAAIAIPRFGSAAGRADRAKLRADLRLLTQSVDLYAAEHDDLTPANLADGSVSTNGAALAQRLTGKTDAGGAVGAGPFGPYLYAIPVNRANKLATVRVNGAPAGAGTHGWRFDTSLRVFQADDSIEAAAIVVGRPDLDVEAEAAAQAAAAD